MQSEKILLKSIFIIIIILYLINMYVFSLLNTSVFFIESLFIAVKFIVKLHSICDVSFCIKSSKKHILKALFITNSTETSKLINRESVIMFVNASFNSVLIN